MFFTDRSNAVLLLWSIFVICVSCLSCFLSVHCCLVNTFRERADLLALLYVTFLFCICYFPMWCPGSGVVLVSISDLCLLSYF